MRRKTSFPFAFHSFFRNFGNKKENVMPLNENKNLKLYYSIKEVAAQLNVSESLLRYWEKEFPHLRPKVSPTNNVRQYTVKDIEQLKVIYNLVKVRGFKLAAARKYMNGNRQGVERSSDILNTLISVRDELKILKKHMDNLS
jgi:DNA-binding transcriptional MerR regulator